MTTMTASAGALGRTAPNRRVPDDRRADRAVSTPAALTGLMFAGLLLLMVIEWVGLAAIVPGLKATRLPTLLAYGLLVMVIVRGGAVEAWPFRQTRLLVGFLVFTAASVVWAVVQTTAFNSIRPFVDYIGFYLVVAFVVDRPSRIRTLGLVSAAVVVTLVARNVDKLTAAVRQGAFRAAYFLGDGNDFAWGLVVLLPLVLYLVIERHNLIVRALGLAGFATALIGIVGTQSRGGTLAVGASTMYYVLFVSKRRGLAIAVVVLALAGGLAFAPSQYLSRMQTVSDYQADNSARSRLQAWGAATQMALDYPFGVGAGNFNSAYGRHYIPDESESQIVWGSGRWISAHSVYFKVLGEYGFPGLALLLTIIGTNFFQNRRSAELLRAAHAAAGGRRSGIVSERWPLVVNMSLIGYSIAAIFLGGLAYPHLFLISGLTVAAYRQAVAAGVAAEPPAAVAGVPAAAAAATAIDRAIRPMARSRRAPGPAGDGR
jgi:probable O-glycosylation ligase (exosortase A-associated)